MKSLGFILVAISINVCAQTEFKDGRGIDITDISFTNHDSTIRVGGSWGRIFRSDDQGETWKDYSLSETSPVVIMKIEIINFLNDSIGFVAGGAGFIYKTTDGGVTWKTVWNEKLGGWITNLAFSDPLHGLATGNRLAIFLRTNDGGNTWTRLHVTTKGSFRIISGGNKTYFCSQGIDLFTITEQDSVLLTPARKNNRSVDLTTAPRDRSWAVDEASILEFSDNKVRSIPLPGKKYRHDIYSITFLKSLD